MIDLRKCNLYEDLGQDMLEWLNRVHVAYFNIVGISL